jgi:hypothetical protein
VNWRRYSSGDKSTASQRVKTLSRLPHGILFGKLHPVSTASRDRAAKIAERQKHNARANNRMHRNAVASVFGVVNHPTASGDAGRYFVRGDQRGHMGGVLVVR